MFRVVCFALLLMFSFFFELGVFVYLGVCVCFRFRVEWGAEAEEEKTSKKYEVHNFSLGSPVHWLSFRVAIRAIESENE